MKKPDRTASCIVRKPQNVGEAGDIRNKKKAITIAKIIVIIPTLLFCSQPTHLKVTTTIEW